VYEGKLREFKEISLLDGSVVQLISKGFLSGLLCLDLFNTTYEVYFVLYVYDNYRSYPMGWRPFQNKFSHILNNFNIHYDFGLIFFVIIFILMIVIVRFQCPEMAALVSWNGAYGVVCRNRN